jgi:diaminopimelate decarboxylase
MRLFTEADEHRGVTDGLPFRYDGIGREALVRPAQRDALHDDLIVGNAGVLLSRVEHLKRGAGKNFLVVDAAMNDLVRPAMYEAFHEIVPLHRDTSRHALVADVVGPICESGDCFAKDRPLQEVGEGEYLALMSAGAYGYTMASRYNTRGMAAEVLVHGSTFELINARETFEQMIAGEKIPAFLK